MLSADSPLALRTCSRHVALLSSLCGVPNGEVGDVTCAIPWFPDPGPGPQPADTAGGELLVQAATGMMGVHGRARGGPRRVGLEICSLAAGTLAATGLLAAALARRRGRPVRGVETSVAEAALCFLRHHLAIATCPEGAGARRLVGAGSGPPFATADGHLVELDATAFEPWQAFWLRLGVDPETISRAWLPFAFRYSLAACALPDAIAGAVRRHTVAELVAAAGDGSHLAVRRLRGCDEVVADSHLWRTWGRVPWAFQPVDGPAPAARREEAQDSGDLPLAGLHVIELTSRVQGPLAGRLLRMLGAAVTRIEPEGGDPARFVAPRAGADGATFVAYNSDKDALQLDYKSPSGRDQLDELLAGADVLLHNWPPGRAERWGLDPASLAPRHPSLVSCHAAGWAEGGAEPEPLGTDVLVQAHLGLGAAMSPPGEPRRTSMLTVVDVLGGLAACEGVLAGLCVRERDGRGVAVRTSLAAAALDAQEHLLAGLAVGAESGRRLGRPLLGALDGPLETADGHLVVAVVGAAALAALAGACGVPASPHRSLVTEPVRRRLLTRPACEWVEVLTAAGVPAAAVRTDLAALPRDPVIAPLLEPAGDCRLPRSPWRFTP